MKLNMAQLKLRSEEKAMDPLLEGKYDFNIIENSKEKPIRTF